MTRGTTVTLSRPEIACAAFSPYTVILTLLLAGLAVVGSLATIDDSGGERFVGHLSSATCRSSGS